MFHKDLFFKAFFFSLIFLISFFAVQAVNAQCGFTIEGRVTDTSGKGIAGMWIRRHTANGDQNHWSATDINGKYQFVCTNCGTTIRVSLVKASGSLETYSDYLFITTTYYPNGSSSTQENGKCSWENNSETEGIWNNLQTTIARCDFQIRLPSPSPSPPPTSPSPLPSPSPSPSPQCNQVCVATGDASNCPAGLSCVRVEGSGDRCRNPQCQEKSNCVCPSQSLSCSGITRNPSLTINFNDTVTFFCSHQSQNISNVKYDYRIHLPSNSNNSDLPNYWTYPNGWSQVNGSVKHTTGEAGNYVVQCQVCSSPDKCTAWGRANGWTGL